MTRYCDGLPLAGCGRLCPAESLIRRETIYGNCLVLIVLPQMRACQCWCGLAGSWKPQKRAVINNIYEKELAIFSLIAVRGHDGL